MKMKQGLGLAGAAFALVLAAGCETYQEPSLDYQATSYTQRNRTDADKLLVGIKELSLAKAQEIAVANNPTYISAYYAITAAKMRYYQALGAYSPVLSAGVGLTHSNTEAERQHNVNTANRGSSFSPSVNARATWMLFDGLSREFQVKIAQAGFNASKALSEDDCRLLIRNVAYAYNEVMLAAENMRIAVEDMQFQVKNLGYTELKFQVGAVPLSDVLNFRALANVAEGSRITAEYQYEVALYALAVLMGYPEGTLPPSITFPRVRSVQLDDLPSVDIYLDNALANRPDLRAYREQLKISDYQLSQTYSSYSPTVSAFAEYGFSSNNSRSNYNGKISHSDSGMNTFSFGVQADWTLFNGFIRYNKVREARANLAAQQYSVANAWLNVVQEVRNAHINYVQSVKQARLYEKTLAITTRQRDLVDDQYRAGNTALTRLNEVQRDLVDAQTTLASAYIKVQNAKAQLEAAAAMNANDYDRAPEPFAEKVSVVGFEPLPVVSRPVPVIPRSSKFARATDKDGYPVWDPATVKK